MTTIAWDGKTLVGDTQATAACMIRRVASKVFRLTKPDGTVVLFGFSGNDQDMHVVAKWIRGGMLDTDRPKFDPDTFNGLLIDGSGCFRLESRCMPLPVLERFHAIGNGRDFAMAAMHLGKNAGEAVEVAAAFDIYTSGPFREVTL